MTRARNLVLDLLSRGGQPCSALAVARDLAACCDQATVYRALHWLEGHGHLESFVLHCQDHGTERYYTAGSSSHRHWFHCVACHRFIDLGTCTLEPLVRQWEAGLDLAIQTHALQVTGLCGPCRRQAGSPPGPA